MDNWLQCLRLPCWRHRRNRIRKQLCDFPIFHFFMLVLTDVRHFHVLFRTLPWSTYWCQAGAVIIEQCGKKWHVNYGNRYVYSTRLFEWLFQPRVQLKLNGVVSATSYCCCLCRMLMYHWATVYYDERLWHYGRMRDVYSSERQTRSNYVREIERRIKEIYLWIYTNQLTIAT